jgi:sulfoxide reductase heme-binding subunit YedZ
MPWRDPAGRLSGFKLAVFLLLFLPATLVAWRYVGGELGPRPVNEAVHQIGNWTLRLVLVSLAVSPGRALLHWPRLLQVRRMLGVAAFAYAAAHLLLYAADQAFDLGKVAVEIVLRIYLAIGFVALLLLAALAVTSTDGMMRRLRPRRWRRLHRLVYAAALLGVLHFFLQGKSNAAEPWIMAGLLAWLLAYRVLPQWWPALIAVLSAGAVALGEAVYYAIKTGVDPLQVLAANLTAAAGLRPAWVVLAIGLSAALAGALRRLRTRPPAMGVAPQSSI